MNAMVSGKAGIPQDEKPVLDCLPDARLGFGSGRLGLIEHVMDEICETLSTEGALWICRLIHSAAGTGPCVRLYVFAVVRCNHWSAS